MKSLFIPNLSTPAGACLTHDNWQRAGVHIVSYDLASWLIKPGLDVLLQFKNGAVYTGWTEEWVLNLSTLLLDKEGYCLVRSSLDGSKGRFSIDSLISIIVHLAPDYVFLPKDAQEIWQEKLALVNVKTTLFSPSDQPAYDALQGLVYQGARCFSITAPDERLNDELIDNHCQCETCSQGFTRAYLHHLYTQTPLLCQRFLIQHNVFQACHLPQLEISI